MATSLQAPEGTWAVLPMGHLNDPQNTFWQLFFLPAGSTRWSNHVEATATATNGGLILADRGGHELVVGIRPSKFMKFTPMIATADAGTSWTTGLIDQPIASRPNALAVSPSGGAVAVVSGPHGDSEIVSATTGLSSWRVILSSSTLASSTSGRRCEASTFTAVAYLGSNALVGTSCNSPGEDGLYLSHGTGWQAVGPKLPASPAGSSRTEVLGITTTVTGATALLGVSGGRGDSVIASWTRNGTTWASSPPLRIPDGDRLVSYGPASGDGTFVLLTDGASDHLFTVGRNETSWVQVPSPPPTTATVAYGGGTIDALAGNSTVLSVYRLAPSGSWMLSQRVHVAIQFGSSNV